MEPWLKTAILWSAIQVTGNLHCSVRRWSMTGVGLAICQAGTSCEARQLVSASIYVTVVQVISSHLL